MSEKLLPRLLLCMLLFISALGLKAQLTVQNAQTSSNWADFYVQNVLLGTGVSAFNVQFTGDSVQIAEFWSSNTSIDIPWGVGLSSGNVEDSPGPNTSTGFTSAVGGGSDPDLVTISGVSIYDAAILEFDFVPAGDSLGFNYVFASEEYNEYVGGGVNDAFGFFLSGPGISGTFSNGAVNLAIVPGTAVPVSINTINLGSYGTYYVNNDTLGQGTIEYDGLTVLMRAEYSVNCGDTYHIKLAIGDGGDPVLDSGVFLEGGSFSSNIIEINIASVNGDSTINEGCGSADILFSRGDTTDTSISFLEFVGTATNGVDFSLLPDTIMLLPGVFDTTITILPFYDGIAEGVEYITIRALSISVCNDTFISEGTLYFYDVPDLHLDITQDTILNGCPIDSFAVHCNVMSGGPPPYHYQWSTGETTSSITIPIDPDKLIDTLIVEVSDSCQLFSTFDTVMILKYFTPKPRVDLLGDSLVNCSGDTLHLKAVVGSGAPPYSYEWPNGDTTSGSVVTVNGTELIIVTVTDTCGWHVPDSLLVGVKPSENFVVSVNDLKDPCPGFEIKLTAKASGGDGPYVYDWSLDPDFLGEDSTQVFMINEDTSILIWVEDFCKRITLDTIDISTIKFDTLKASLRNGYVACPGLDFEMKPVVIGGVEPYAYKWESGEDTSTVTGVFKKDVEFLVTVTDFCKNRDTAQALVQVEQHSALSLFINGDGRICYGDETDFYVSGRGGAGDYTYDWSWKKAPVGVENVEDLGEGHFLITGTQNNTYLFTVVDRCGTSFTDSTEIIIDHCLFIPNVITPNGDGKNDAFIIKNIEAFGDAHLRIYNRWGTKVLDVQPYLNDWEPNDISAGTYFYILLSESFPEIRGDMTIIKD
ncbi:MAG: choice-of-anchor L domain-containing protein [Flavobacteriales bacterium]